MKDYWERTKGVADVKEELTKAVALPITHKKEASKFGVKASHGVLLYGPPGTGKTTLLRGLSSMLEMRYVEVNPAQILSKWYGESERKTKEVFDEAEQNPPCILALDEVESVGKKRDSYMGDDVTPKVLNIVLMEMDRISREDIDVVVVGTTNKPDALDRALLRPGRFDKVIYMGPPDERRAGRDIQVVHLRERGCGKGHRLREACEAVGEVHGRGHRGSGQQGARRRVL